jgi:small subunit ribosomal protein S3Ae
MMQRGRLFIVFALIFFFFFFFFFLFFCLLALLIWLLQVRDMGWTPANRTEGQRTVAENLKGRVFEVSLADLQKDESQFYQNIKLKCQEVQGQDALTSFHGLDFTTDKKRSLVRKWQTLIEAHLDVKTTDGYFLRLFCIGFTRRMTNQMCKTSYAQASQVKRIRRKMFSVMQREAQSVDLKNLVDKFISNSIGERVAKECQGIYPLQNVFIRKVKMLKTPKFDAYKFAELHSASTQVWEMLFFLFCWSLTKKKKKKKKKIFRPPLLERLPSRSEKTLALLLIVPLARAWTPRKLLP